MEGSKTVLLVGTLDTKGAEYAYLRERLRVHGVDTILADAGVEEPMSSATPMLRVTRSSGSMEPTRRSCAATKCGARTRSRNYRRRAAR